MFARHHIYILNSAIVVQCVCVCVLCVCSFVYIHVCAMYTGKERLDVFEAKIEESEKAGSIYRELEGCGCPVVVVQLQSTGCTSQVSLVQFSAAASLFTFLYFNLKNI